MKKAITNKLIWYFGGNYPCRLNTQTQTPQHISKYALNANCNSVIVGIGGNYPKTKLYFKLLFKALLKDSRFSIVKSSAILKNPAFGYINQDDFLNSVIYLKTSLSPNEALRAFLRYESRFKRIRSFANAPRSLDIDIIFYTKANAKKHIKINTHKLKLPHPEYKNRDSVMLPLAQLKTK